MVPAVLLLPLLGSPVWFLLTRHHTVRNCTLDLQRSRTFYLTWVGLCSSCSFLGTGLAWCHCYRDVRNAQADMFPCSGKWREYTGCIKVVDLRSASNCSLDEERKSLCVNELFGLLDAFCSSIFLWLHTENCRRLENVLQDKNSFLSCYLCSHHFSQNKPEQTGRTRCRRTQTHLTCPDDYVTRLFTAVFLRYILLRLSGAALFIHSDIMLITHQSLMGGGAGYLGDMFGMKGLRIVWWEWNLSLTEGWTLKIKVWLASPVCPNFIVATQKRFSVVCMPPPPPHLLVCMPDSVGPCSWWDEMVSWVSLSSWTVWVATWHKPNISFERNLSDLGKASVGASQ